MQRRQVLRVLAACPVCAAAAKSAMAGTGHEWGYNGDVMPDNWSELSEDYHVCGAGRQQSPIDLADATRADVDAVTTRWRAVSDFELVNNGHTLQANMPKGSVSIVNDKPYDLLQFHFHHQSEHTVDGVRYPMEAHFVHKSNDGDLLVLGIFLDEGQENDVLAPLWAVAPTSKGIARVAAEFHPQDLLPRSSSHFTYAGSLTTPPCSEIVTWVVYEETAQASKKQIADFAEVFPHNYRPLQPLNRRQILQGF
ncbi:carbonic anhydrase [uncultured Roseovarius sp.]|uniref:carbonic anhydrase n=1 Tax=uncultured Roseovarius sp. TaxID=293344 RepID=UPI002617AD15|nr:carbonic anhydrase family protein [uncultured Roseovarius sp.]